MLAGTITSVSNSERLRVLWGYAMKAGGVRYRYPYQCRHTYASLMVSAGESPEWVAEQMGHQDSRLVAVVYGRWLRRPDVGPGEQAAVVYAGEWTAITAQLDMTNVTDDMPDGAMEESACIDGGHDEDDEF